MQRETTIQACVEKVNILLITTKLWPGIILSQPGTNVFVLTNECRVLPCSRQIALLIRAVVTLNSYASCTVSQISGAAILCLQRHRRKKGKRRREFGQIWFKQAAQQLTAVSG